jgi:hypothetical protein
MTPQESDGYYKRLAVMSILTLATVVTYLVSTPQDLRRPPPVERCEYLYTVEVGPARQGVARGAPLMGGGVYSYYDCGTGIPIRQREGNMRNGSDRTPLNQSQEQDQNQRP